MSELVRGLEEPRTPFLLNPPEQSQRCGAGGAAAGRVPAQAHWRSAESRFSCTIDVTCDLPAPLPGRPLQGLIKVFAS